MINTFNANIAIDFSLEVAIFLQQLAQWSFYNLAHNKHIHDGTVWTYNTVESFKKFFPYWTTKQIWLVIQKSIDQGLVQKGNYNKTTYDRTSWYALTDKGRRYFPELNDPETSKPCTTSDFPKKENGFSQKENTIPTNNTTNKKDINKKTLISKKGINAEQLAIVKENNPHDLPEQTIEDWIRKRKFQKNPVTLTDIISVNSTLTKIKDLLKISPTEAFAKMVAKGWKSLEIEYFEKPEKPQGRSTNNGSLDPFACWS